MQFLKIMKGSAFRMYEELLHANWKNRNDSVENEPRIRTCLPVMVLQKMWVRSLDQEGPLEEEMETHSSIMLG